MLNSPDSSKLHWNFQRAALHDLAAYLQQLGSSLVVRRGEAVAVLETIRQQHGIANM